MSNTNQYNEWIKLVNKLCNCDELSKDLLHDVYIQVIHTEKYQSLDEKSKKFYLVRVIQNQCQSSSSPFHYKYRKFVWSEIHPDINIKDEEYEEPPEPSLEWIHNTLQDQLRQDPDFWYKKGLFEIYLKQGTLKGVHKQTTIPLYEVKNTIREMKTWINKKWNEYLKKWEESN